MTPDIWQVSDPVPQREKPAKQAISVAVVSAELSTLRSALNAIPNRDDAALSYDDWRDVVFAIHDATGGSDEGLALAHEFSSRSSKYDPEFLDNRVWPYVGKRSDGANVTVRTIYSKAGSHGWVDPTTVDDFTNEVAEPDDAIDAEFSEIKKPGRFEFQRATQFSAGQPPGWLIKNVLPRAELVEVYGESGAGKSFTVLDMLGHIVEGLDWRGHKVKPGLTGGYIAAEGAAGFRLRLNAAAKHHQWKLERLGVMAGAPNFLEKADVVALGKSMLAWGRLDVLAVDTLARVTAGANENSGEDMGRALHHCKVLHEVTGATILLVHHSGKDASKGSRGWSGIKAAVDCEIEITRNGDARCMTITKLKDGPGEGSQFAFKLADVPLGIDEDGDVFGSCVVEHLNAPAGGPSLRSLTPRGLNERLVMRVLEELVGVGGEGVPHTDLVTACVDQMPFDEGSGKRDRRRDQVTRAIEALREAARVEVKGTLLTLAGG